MKNTPNPQPSPEPDSLQVDSIQPAPLPPGPRTPGLYNLLFYILRPHAFFETYRRRYGDRFTVRLIGYGKFVFLSDPGAIEDVFKGDPDVLHSGEANALFAEILGTNSLLVLDGAEHKRQRVPQVPPFLGERMRTHTRTIHQAALECIGKWKPGQTVRIETEMREITLNVILRSVFGISENDELIERLAEQTRALLYIGTHPMALLGALLPPRLQMWTPQGRRMRRDLRAVDSTIAELLTARRKSVGNNNDDADDILSILLTMKHEDGTPLSDQELRDHLITLLLAGHDTTAVALAWAFRAILSRPEVLEKIRAELREVFPDNDNEIHPDGLERLPYLDAVIKETMRVHPIVAFVVRRLTRPFSAGGILYPAGVILAPATLLVHKRPDVFPAPDRFRPERFLDQKPNPYAWIPFGGGTRRCLGMFFALVEMRVVLATALSRVNLRLETPHVGTRRSGILIAPADGTRAVVSGW